ncbi:hypothetical protein DTW90_23815 [Neorhizobium sp. P12A]|uniref:hypothetical protein n=1 Tax=Neorhizobium sp. P12A TaxID=2268027 RepID=UPI0011EC5165|nr:hypothetical protein [Neorhizobium sp. P12A]KAA0694362.1 hypothetical protein DTW90_23815 [Neorhizobium sp. P12A]
MAQYIEPAGPKPFSTLTVHQRDMVLMEISKSLHFTALASRASKDRRWRRLDALGNKIDREHQKMAADFSEASDQVVHQALGLLAE